jgi:hypothetical protein
MSKLDENTKPRRYFDVKNKTDLNVFKSFIMKNAWGNQGCPFLLEEPYLSIPDMIRYKITNEFLEIK